MAVKMMGAQVKRKEDPRLITGTSTYVGDLVAAGHALRGVRPEPARPRARSAGSTHRPALKRPGVVAVVTGARLRKLTARRSRSTGVGRGRRERVGESGASTTRSSIDRVRHVGEAVAAVIADARGARGRWRRRRGRRLGAAAGGDATSAARPGSPAPRSSTPTRRSNIEHENRDQAGDPDAAFAKATRVVQASAWSASGSAACRWRGAPRWPRPTRPPAASSSGRRHQAPHGLRNDSPTSLALPAEPDPRDRPRGGRRLRREVRLLPGGRGAGGARASSTACRCAGSRRGSSTWWPPRTAAPRSPTSRRRSRTTAPSPALRMHVTRRHRRLSGLHVHPRPDADDGRRRLPASPTSISRSTCVFTNTTPVAAYRGAGRPEAAYYLERSSTSIAAGARPRRPRRSGARTSSPPERLPLQDADRPALRQRRVRPRADQGARGLEYDAAPRRAAGAPGSARNDRKLLGIGMACYVEMCGFGPFESAMVRVEPCGTVTAYTGTSAHGQGHETTFAQIIADHLGVDSTRSSSATATPRTRRWATAPAAAGASRSAARRSCARP